MARPLMNEAERFLLENWEEARHLEDSMESVRRKYKDLFQRVVDAVAKAHPQLDAHVLYLTPSWDEGGYIVFSRASWPGGDGDDPPGLYVGNLRIDILTAENSEAPEAYIWVPRRVNIDFDVARTAMTTEGKRFLGSDKFETTCSVGEKEDLLEFEAPSKKELLTSLASGDGQGFVDRLCAQFDLMAQFVPALDKLFSWQQKSKRK